MCGELKLAEKLKLKRLHVQYICAPSAINRNEFLDYVLTVTDGFSVFTGT